MIVELIQFLRPHGEQRKVATEISDDCKDGYELMQRSGARLTAEVLRTGEISCTIEFPEGDFDISLTSNGPDVQKGIERMLKDFTEENLKNWKQSAAH